MRQRAPSLLGPLVATAVAVAVVIGVALVLRGEESGPGKLPEDWRRGFNLTAYRAGALSGPAAEQALHALRDTGTTDVAIVTQWYMDDARASRVEPDPEKTPSDDSLLKAMARARDLDMEVMLKPHVDLRDGSFRGHIRPDDREAWFESYQRMIEHYAQLATRGEASIFVVGVELTSMARNEARFRRIIAAARERFGGDLTFAANWSAGAARIRFWDALDFIGIDAYMPLSRRRNPTVRELMAAWRRRWVPPIQRLSERVGRPVLFTEMGYQSRLGAARSPHEAHGRVSQIAQARAYEAAYRVWAEESRFRGIYWWQWPADSDPANTGPGSFSPEGKLAEDVVRAYNGAPPRRRSGG